MKNEEILRRAENLWNKAPKFKTWTIELSSGTVVVGFVGKAGKTTKAILLNYITRNSYIIREMYNFKTENPEKVIKFCRNEIEGIQDPEASQEELVADTIEAFRESEESNSFIEELNVNSYMLDNAPKILETGINTDEIDINILDHLKWSDEGLELTYNIKRLDK